MNKPSSASYFLTTIPNPTRDLLSSIVAEFRSLLAENWVGIYLHGSLAMGCFNPISSDIDFIVVVKEPLTIATKQKMAALSLELAEKAPSKGLEFSVVLLSVTQHFIYPTPFEFHYSKGWHQQYQANQVDFDAHNDDKDLAAHFTIIRHRGIVLSGASIMEVFSEVPAHDYLDSIAEDAAWSYRNITAGDDKAGCLVPTYAVLNFCRVIAFIRQAAVLSKLEGGRWGLEHLPQTYAPIIQAALHDYTSGESVAVDCNLLKQFAAYAMTIINPSKDETST